MLIESFGFHVVLAASPHAESEEVEAAVQRGRLPGCGWNDQESTAWGELLVPSSTFVHEQQLNSLGVKFISHRRSKNSQSVLVWHLFALKTAHSYIRSGIIKF